ncbi:hypothetical protein DMC64_36780 [Amycolatopsis sp. WAC 04197]|uniref:cytochrome P450 n=1 Tax=Amycolatopsis sp. WAC 04197 TaxID=2203199 RepID=UPI000F79B462|nr:cytochrome P450 [Amycolatopsis sp. WAC 04197]RSN39884.1 hypothetical protein DMC64_36780 [Amycolatopsis sp. WAC 04197]
MLQKQESPAEAATAPGAIPLVGHALRLLRPWSLLHSLPAQGDLVRLYIGRLPVYVVCSPKLVQEVLVHDSDYDRGGAVFDQVRTVMGNGLITCGHDRHRRSRQLVQPVFSRSRLPRYAELMVEHSTPVIESWRDGQVLDARAAMHTIIRRVSIATLFSSRINAEQFERLQQDIGTIAAGWLRRLITPRPLRRLTGGRQWASASKRVHEAIDDSLRSAGATGCPVTGATADVPEVLLAARDADGGGFSHEEIHDELISMFLAAVESSSTVLSWTLDLLAHHPEVQDRAAEEVRRVVGEREMGWPDVDQLPYLKQIVHESLRLHPPTWLLTRITTRETVLGGHPLPAGVNIAYSAYLLGRDPAVFADPDRFDPDRWTGAAPPRGSFVPWGGGSRLCIGNTVSLAEIVIVLAEIVRSWRWEPVRRRPATARVSMLHVPKSVRVKLRSRKEAVATTGEVR